MASWVDRYAAGETYREIAATAGVHESTVRRHVHTVAEDVNRHKGPRGRADVSTEEIRRLREDDGLSWYAIADATGMSRTGARYRYATHHAGGRPDRPQIYVHRGAAIKS
jgi:predicted transcriptional regulator